MYVCEYIYVCIMQRGEAEVHFALFLYMHAHNMYVCVQQKAEAVSYVHMHTNKMYVCMQRRKAEAVQLEDYSAAKDIKAELDCLRARLEQLGMFVCVFLGGVEVGGGACVRPYASFFFFLFSFSWELRACALVPRVQLPGFTCSCASTETCQRFNRGACECEKRAKKRRGKKEKDKKSHMCLDAHAAARQTRHVNASTEAYARASSAIRREKEKEEEIEQGKRKTGRASAAKQAC